MLCRRHKKEVLAINFSSIKVQEMDSLSKIVASNFKYDKISVFIVVKITIETEAETRHIIQAQT